MNFYKGLLLSLLLLLVAHNSFAVTEFISVINKAGSEDYNTLTLWEAAMDDAGDLTDGTVKTGGWDNKTVNIPVDGTAVDWDGGASTGTLIHASENNGGSGGDQYLIDVTGGALADNDVILDVATSTDGFTIDGVPDSAIVTAHVYDDDGELTDIVSIDGLTTDATNYWKITVPSGERHDGKQYGNGARVTTANVNEHTFELKDNFCLLEWLAVSHSGGGGARDAIGLRTDSDGSTVRYCMVTNPNMEQGIETSPAAAIYIYDNIIYDIGALGISIGGFSSPAAEVYNNTVYNCGSDNISFADGTNNGIVKNNLALTTGGSCYSLGNATVLTNGSSDATGSAGLQNLVAATELVNPGTDHHLKSGATSIDAATDLVTTPSGVEIDIDGRDRDAEGDIWDIGADEIVTAAAAAGQVIYINQL